MSVARKHHGLQDHLSFGSVETKPAKEKSVAAFDPRVMDRDGPPRFWVSLQGEDQ
jgi:hypothetical protein